eukprot:5876672-Amphidinium_carterae.1
MEKVRIAELTLDRKADEFQERQARAYTFADCYAELNPSQCDDGGDAMTCVFSTPLNSNPSDHPSELPAHHMLLIYGAAFSLSSTQRVSRITSRSSSHCEYR